MSDSTGNDNTAHLPSPHEPEQLTGGAELALPSEGIFDSARDVTAGIARSMQQIAEKLGQFLSAAIEDAANLKVSTYVSANMDAVTLKDGQIQGAKLRALTYIKIDGDTLVCVPEEDGEVDSELWTIHMEMVKQAQVSRAELIKAAVTAATSLAGLGGK